MEQLRRSPRLSRTLAALVLAVFACAPLSAQVKVAPYYNLQVSEGASVPSKGDWMFSLDLVNDLGVIVQPAENQRIFGFYELKYNGPGLRREEGQSFTDRLMDNVFVLRHHYTFLDDYTVKTQLDYMKENQRTGTNEPWTQGLYDFNRTGGAVTLERKFEQGFTLGANAGYHYMEFPNYSDLLTEVRLSSGTDELSSGKQNQNIYQAGLAFTWGATRVNAEYNLMAYTKQKTVVNNVQSDGSYYSGDLQKDTIFSFGVEHNRKLLKILTFAPSASFRLKSSNQNYQFFETATSSVPVRYFGQYYDYSQFNVALPLFVPLSKTWEMYLDPEWNVKTYASRPPRDADGSFLPGTQVNNLYVLGVGFSVKSNDVTKTTLFYTYQLQSSNMKFEKYLPYNYAGHYFGISFNYTY